MMFMVVTRDETSANNAETRQAIVVSELQHRHTLQNFPALSDLLLLIFGFR